MPLDGQDGESPVYDAFDHAVSGAADRQQIVSRTVYSLVMGGIDHSAHAVQLIEEILTAQIAVIDMVELVAADPFVIVCGDDVLKQIAAEMDVDELESLADAKNGFTFRDEARKRLKLQNIQCGIYMERAVICLPEEGGGDVASSGKEQVRGAVGGFRVCCSEVGDAHSIQGGFIVLRILLVAKDGDGWVFVHDSFPQYQNVTYIVCGAALLVDCFFDRVFHKNQNTGCAEQNHSIYFYKRLV